MKKTTVLLTLLLCGLFNTMSATSYLRWSVTTQAGGATLKIKVNGVVEVNVEQARYAAQQSGVIPIPDFAFVEYEAASTDNLVPMLCVTTETDLVDDWLASYNDYFYTYGYPLDPYIYSESGSFNTLDDFDFTIQLSTQFVN
ncbi:hypothetical protein CLU83_3909 [Flavobacterium sp. 1]|uniref:hypothetical protein n=1 Tax=Flavobacterium sp. 1 TaxID=2035200 RepID=UPI000CCB477E|nr:hypothetical protein [Flavobacterium sp. 1]PJJ10483.1 hypothetical protein CLU83_3909 [Flavobacterium sp. 1]